MTGHQVKSRKEKGSIDKMSRIDEDKCMDDGHSSDGDQSVDGISTDTSSGNESSIDEDKNTEGK